MKNLQILRRITNYMLLASPILVSSFFAYASKYPAWANTLLLISLFAVLFSFLFYTNYKNKKEATLLEVSLLVLSLLSAIVFTFSSSSSFVFNLFGKGIQEWSASSILVLFLAAAFFISLKGKLNKIAIIASLSVLTYTVINYILVKNGVSIANYTAYINIPMLSFAKLINLPFVFTIVTLLFSLISFYIEKKSLIFTKIENKKWYTVILLLILLLTSCLLIRNVLRYVAANNYLNASQAFSENKVSEAKTSLNRAISIAPFDEYYLGRIEITTSEINNLLASKSTNTAELQNNYKTLVESQINDAQKAIAYDNKNPRNYMALGLAYERSMLLSKEDGYTKSIEAYEKARELASDKDYVDVVKAKLSFGVEKESEALKYIDNALKYNSSSSPALFISSQYYASKNNFKSAIEYGEKAVMTSPQATDARLSLGLLYLQDKRYDAAIQMFGSVLQLTKGENLGAMYYLGAAYKAKGDIANLKLVIAELDKRVDPNSKEMKDLRSGIGESEAESIIKK